MLLILHPISLLSFECHHFYGAFAKLRKVTINCVMSLCLSVRLSAWNNTAPTGRIVMKFDICVYFEHLSRKFNIHLNVTRITGTSHEDQYTFVIISRPVLLRMRNVSDKIVERNSKRTFYIH